jgi:hypothetical protein
MTINDCLVVAMDGLRRSHRCRQCGVMVVDESDIKRRRSSNHQDMKKKVLPMISSEE